MNLEESNSFVEQMEKNNKNKKTVLTILAICAILIVILLGIISYVKRKDEQKLKMFINDTQVPISSTLFLQDEDGTYVNIKEIASMLNYSYQKGEYKKYTEDENSCYLSSPYEIISMNADSETVTKYMINKNKVSATTSASSETTNNTVSKDLVVVDETTGEQSINMIVDSENEMSETFFVNDNTIKSINNELYLAFSDLPKMLSVQLNTNQANRIKIYSVDSLAQSALKIATNLGYSEVSNIYENLTAMVDNMLVVGNGTNYGVVSLEDGHEIISLKYEKIVYRQNTEEFFVTAESSVGIVKADGSTVIRPTDYDAISNLDELNKLYLVEKDRKYGVVNAEGKAIVYADYDSIGIENKEEFQNEDIRNFNLLFDKCIPVESNGKMGLIDIDGNEKAPCVYTLGYVAGEETDTKDQNKSKNNKAEDDDEEESNTVSKNSTTSTEDFDSVLTIPERVGIQGIIVNRNGLYGIYDAQVGHLIIPCACSKIYARKRGGITNYYLEYNEQEIELESYLESNGLKSVNRQTEEQVENEPIEKTEE